MQSLPEEWRENENTDPALSNGSDKSCSEARALAKELDEQKEEEKESLMMELTRLVQKTVRESSWWEQRGVDCTILAVAFISLPAAFWLLASCQVLYFTLGLLAMGVAHTVITVKGTHLASHGALSESLAWRHFWAIFFIEVCGSFTARAGVRAHVKMHHAHTNVIGLGDSSTWKVPFLPRSVYLFIAPLALPIITPIVAMKQLKGQPLWVAVRTVVCVCVGVCAQYMLLCCVSGLECSSALLVMLLSRAMFSVPYIHVNIFQHIGLPMFSLTRRPKRIYQMSHGVLNLPRNPLLDWMFGHSLINCHVEHHLFPTLSDNMCLKVKPIVSQYLKAKSLPYQEDSYLARLYLFFHKYQELMVFAPPITELVGVQ
ncbi:fatty acid desaturase 6 [Electrophorus electricus]|uniref:fatty acid desaturase 6 n=1 Tax=Electrophorus electricus TaxID=8005 RepID=UPI0015D010BE|nr:fatty acid desaturase 6 [Electrophorus electricus]XP_026887504.2 fatty acid desaturase 6 [Electrophorus electricus]XP_026887505.2 fatty acid desaturase 6 [Electrophorus electricus]